MYVAASTHGWGPRAGAGGAWGCWTGGRRARGGGPRPRGSRRGRKQARAQPDEEVLRWFQDYGGEELCEECCGEVNFIYYL